MHLSEISISLIVLRAADVQKALAFYQAIGLSFEEEQHGSGPIHYACTLADTVIELYPGEPGSAPERKQGGATLIGLSVPSLDESLAALAQLGTAPTSAPKDSPWGRRAVILDPDGRAIELTEQKS